MVKVRAYDGQLGRTPEEQAAVREAREKRVRSPGMITHERGRSSEETALRLALDLPFPWIQAARACTPDEDAHGVDVVVETDRGDIRIQVKSSKRAASKFKKALESRPEILDPDDLIVLIVGDRPDQEVGEELGFELIRVYNRLKSATSPGPRR